MNLKFTIAIILSIIIASSFTPTIWNVFAQIQNTNLENILTHNEVTLLLEGKSISPKGHLHLYDTGSFHIMDGHVSVAIPCIDNKPLLEVWGGIAGDRTFLKPIALHSVANFSTPSFTCMYYANIASEMGPNGWLITDVVLVNLSNNQITSIGECRYCGD
jgi:hypothetical protein